MKKVKEKTTHVSERKKKAVKELSELGKGKKTILVASIKNIPGGQFQEIVNKLRGKAVVKVPKRNLIHRALDSNKEENIPKLKEKIKSDFAILFSDIDAFDLAVELIKNQSPSKAKAGQIAPIDIEIQEGPTDLVPGPAISELGGLGIQIQIQGGKIHIKEPKVIVKQGDKISSEAAAVMSKLDIKPFSIGFTPICALDNQEKKFYSSISIDREGTLNGLKFAYAKALPFAVSINYISQDTIRLLLQKAARQEKRLIKVITGEPDEEPVVLEQTQTTHKADKKEEKVDGASGLASLF
jgi:large subunit ribosomal protein L10